ncbi:hypothetical protein [Priestia megaterium]|uniref:hypothetical protein n=1 Tax=Priestia megaterium TaxID=1404 RepID=UPI00203C2AEC|nr:hypothetical protein [Priestia megaterium]MCM3196332.1 hypothetical protein [Priestia megaterium]
MGLFTKMESNVEQTVIKVKEKSLPPVTVHTFADEASREAFENLFTYARVQGDAVKEEMITESNYRMVYSANNQYKNNLLTRDVYLGFTNKAGEFFVEYKSIEEFVKFLKKAYKINATVELV